VTNQSMVRAWVQLETCTWERVRSGPTIEHCPADSRPGNASLEFIQGGQAEVSSDESNAEQLSRGHYKELSNSGNVNSQIMEEKLFPLLL
jgi:hypothetical protein